MQVWLRPPEAEDNAPGTAEELLRRASGGVAQVFRYWDRKRGTRAMPSPDDIDFLELRPWLAGIMMIEVVADARGKRVAGDPIAGDLVYRVVGERAVRQRGYDPSGMSVRQAAYGDPVPVVLERYAAVVDQKRPLYCWSEVKRISGQVSDTLALPLSRDGDAVDCILVYGEDRRSETA